MVHRDGGVRGMTDEEYLERLEAIYHAVNSLERWIADYEEVVRLDQVVAILDAAREAQS